MKRRGLLVIISSPSDGGKTTIIKKVLEKADNDFVYSISATTRAKRPTEEHGRDYYFISLNEFKAKRRRREFLEWAEVHEDYYATPKAPVENWLESGKLVLLDLDVDGGLQVKKKHKDALLIFVNPPSFNSLIDRLKERKTESEKEIKKRLERYPKEIKKSEHYDYQIVNENLEETTRRILQIINNRYNKINGGLND